MGACIRPGEFPPLQTLAERNFNSRCTEFASNFKLSSVFVPQFLYRSQQNPAEVSEGAVYRIVTRFQWISLFWLRRLVAVGQAWDPSVQTSNTQCSRPVVEIQKRIQMLLNISKERFAEFKKGYNLSKTLDFLHSEHWWHVIHHSLWSYRRLVPVPLCVHTRRAHKMI